MNYFRRDIGRSHFTRPFREALKHVSFAAFSGKRPFSALAAIPNVTFHSVTEDRSALQDTLIADFLRPAQRLDRIGCLQTDKVTLFVNLTGQPVDIASPIDATHWISTTHTENCNTFSVTLSTPIREEMA
jgi:hypothetical protein